MVAVAALALTGCTSGESGYLETLRTDTPTLTETFTDDELMQLGEAVCEALDAGMSGHRAAGSLETSGLSIAEAGTVVLAASGNLCPEHAVD